MTGKEKAIRINKWSPIETRNGLDDAVKQILDKRVGWQEYYSILNGRLLISFLAICFSSFAAAIHYIVSFDQAMPVFIICAIAYFVMIGCLQFYSSYVERGCFYQAIENDGTVKRAWKWSSELKSFDDKYTLLATYSQENRFAQGKIMKSICSYITEDGEIVKDLLELDVDKLYKDLIRDT